MIAATGVATALAIMATPAFAANGAGAGGSMAGASMSLAAIPQWVFISFDYFVLSLLGLASVAGVALIIDAMIHTRESKIAPPETTEHLRSLIAGRQFKDLMDFTSTDQTFISQSLYAAIRRAHLKYPAMREAMENSLSEQTANIFRRLEPMNVIGNIGPLLGLLGTVLGMIMAFTALMEKGGNVNPADLSGGIGTALWHTFLGLFVAIPCLVVYGLYRTKADRIVTKSAVIAEELLEGLRPENSSDDSSKKRSSKSGRETAPSPVPQPQAAEE
jgi:biopolymer transport protein ExbB